jgi:hypothetical protein
MKKILIAIIALITIAGAVDLTGRIGMGLGFTPDVYDTGGFFGLGLGSVDIAVTRLGLNEKWSVEPIAQFALDGNGSDGVYFALSGLGNMLFKGHSKTNVYGKIGLGFMLDTHGTETMFGFNLPFGFGLEHFINNHFSINLAALSGFAFVSNPGGVDGSYYQVRFGNEKPFALYLLWYY